MEKQLSVAVLGCGKMGNTIIEAIEKMPEVKKIMGYDPLESQLEGTKKNHPQVDTIMLGRGVMRNPGIVEQLLEGTPLDKEKLRAFHDDLLKEYIEYNSGIIPVLFKMKEIWAYMGVAFPGGEKCLKKLRKTDKLEVYEEMVNELFALLS